jgi:peptidyl-tRNA hydrolase, PTH1 family
MKLIVGLGNPGEKYKNTRHNVGFIVLDEQVKRLGLVWKFEKKFNSDIAKNSEVIFAKPQSMMNNSGGAISKLVNFYDIDLENLLIIHDDVDMDFGKIRKKMGMSPGGHHGVENIVKKLGSLDFWRMKIGIGRPVNNRFNVVDYVLSELAEGEIETVKNIHL